MTDSPIDTRERTDRTDRQPFLDLSLPQLVAGATAAATSAILISHLNLLGTVLGAAFASIVSAVVTAGLVGGWHRVRAVWLDALALAASPRGVAVDGDG